MSSRLSDPLLGTAKFLVIVIQAIFALLAAGICLGIGALLTVGRAEVLAKIAETDAPAAAFGMLILAFALVAVLLAIGFRFFTELRGIINSVAEGDPFAAENANRLSRMGWIGVGAHALGLALAGFAAWFHPYLVKLAEAGDDTHFEFGFGIDVGGILLTLILFILARVFREGTRMREDLEGTV